MHEPALQKYYKEKVVPELQKSRGYANIHDVPTIQKVVINSGIKADSDKAWVQEVQKEISAIAGQRAVITKARKSISNFKLREGMPIGVMVTLRGARMWEFLYRTISVSLPVIRDFRGVSNKLDGAGNYTLGINDHTIFPEVHVDTARKGIGMDISIVTTATNDEEGRELLKLIGMPFRRTAKEQAEQDNKNKEEAAEAVAG